MDFEEVRRIMMAKLAKTNGLRVLMVAALSVLLTLPAWSSVTFYVSDPTRAYSELSNSRRVDHQVMQFIRGARTTLDVAIYNLTHSQITDSLIAAHRRGVRVRVVTDFNSWNDRCQQLVDAGIPVVRGASSTSDHMHHKFIVRDSNAVLNGSYNFTWNGARTDRNTIAVFRSAPAMAALFTEEFEQMFVRRNFGTAKTFKSRRSGNRVTIGSTTNRFDVTIYFSPEGGATAALVREIDRADTSIYFSVFTFTDRRVSDALIRAQARGVRIRGVFDSSQNSSQSASKFDILRTAGVPVRLDSLPGTAHFSGLLHDKIMTIDHGTNADAIAIIGSMNFTVSGDDGNDENLVIIHRPASARSLRTHINSVFNNMSHP